MQHIKSRAICQNLYTAEFFELNNVLVKIFIGEKFLGKKAK